MRNSCTSVFPTRMGTERINRQREEDKKRWASMERSKAGMKK